jgi:hypothetical protein
MSTETALPIWRLELVVETAVPIFFFGGSSYSWPPGPIMYPVG